MNEDKLPSNKNSSLNTLYSQYKNYLRKELKILLYDARFIRSIYQIGILITGYYFLNYVSTIGYSVQDTLLYMSIFFLAGLAIPLPKHAKSKVNSFSKEKDNNNDKTQKEEVRK